MSPSLFRSHCINLCNKEKKTGRSHILTLVYSFNLPDRGEGKAGGEGWRERKGLVISKSKAVLCLPRSKTLFNGMILAAQPTSKRRMSAKPSFHWGWGPQLWLKVTSWVGGTCYDFLCTQGAGRVTFFRMWYKGPTFSHCEHAPRRLLNTPPERKAYHQPCLPNVMLDSMAALRLHSLLQE